MPDDGSTDGYTGNMTPTHGALIVIGSAAAVLIVIGVLFRPRKSSSS